MIPKGRYRNKSCPCGSGKKAKRCCGRARPKAAPTPAKRVPLSQAIVQPRAKPAKRESMGPAAYAALKRRGTHIRVEG